MMEEFKGERRLAAIMFTDMVGYSALAQKNESLALQLLEEHRALLRPLFPKYNGVEVKTIGDAFFIEFPSALHAVRCAVEIQKALHEYNSSSPETIQIKLRIGVHLGDVIHRENDVYGDGVNIASRIEPQAEPGGICISQQVFDQIRNNIKEPLQKLGVGDLKNIQIPVTIYKVFLPWEASRAPLALRLKFLFKKRKAKTITALLLIVIAGLTWFVVTRINRAPDLAAEEKTIAILPISHSGNVILAEGMARDLTAELENIPDVMIISTKGSSFLTTSDLSDSIIASELGARFLLRCNLEFVNNKVKMTASLFDYKNKQEKWRESYEKSRAQLVEIRNEIIAKILDDLTIGRDNVRNLSYTASSEAYDLYLEGLYHLGHSDKKEAAIAIEKLSESANKDSTFIPSITALSRLQMESYQYSWDTSKKILSDAEANCRKAFARDTTNSSVLSLMGDIEETKGNESQGIKLMRKGLDVNNNNKLALGRLSERIPRDIDESQNTIALLLRLQKLEPLDWKVTLFLGIDYATSNNVPEALKWFQRTIALRPTSSIAWNNMGNALEGLGNYEMAAQCYGNAIKVDPHVDSYLYYTRILMQLGRMAEADSILELGMKQSPSEHEFIYLSGVISELQKKTAVAKQIFYKGLVIVQRKIDASPLESENYADKGRFEARLGMASEAVKAALHASKLDSTHAFITIKIAETFAILKKKGEMLKWFKRAKNRSSYYDDKYLSSDIDFGEYRNDADLLFIADMK